MDDDEHLFDMFLVAYVVVAVMLAAVRWPPFFLAATMHALVLLLAVARTSEGFAMAATMDAQREQLGFLQTLGICKGKIEDSLSGVVAKLKQSQTAADAANAAASDVQVTRDLYLKHKDPDMAKMFPIDDDDRSFTLDPRDAEDEERFNALMQEYRLLHGWMSALPEDATAAIKHFVSAS